MDVVEPGQTVGLQSFDIAFGHNQGGTTFVYAPGDGTGVIHGFEVRGALSLVGADFGNSIADVLRNTGDIGGRASVTDPVTGDAIRLAGLSKAELKAHPHDVTFSG